LVVRNLHRYLELRLVRLKLLHQLEVVLRHGVELLVGKLRGGLRAIVAMILSASRASGIACRTAWHATRHADARADNGTPTNNAEGTPALSALTSVLVADCGTFFTGA